jgi:hypothetical protein
VLGIVTGVDLVRIRTARQAVVEVVSSHTCTSARVPGQSQVCCSDRSARGRESYAEQHKQADTRIEKGFVDTPAPTAKHTDA